MIEYILGMEPAMPGKMLVNDMGTQGREVVMRRPFVRIGEEGRSVLVLSDQIGKIVSQPRAGSYPINTWICPGWMPNWLK